jgi:glycosyltransferase involved in cell wall biosynthesis
MEPPANLDAKPRTVLIVGPPWPRSGTARVIQNQIDFYRDRGYSTVFICVPIHCSYTEHYPEWDEIRIGIQELGADRVFFAPIDYRQFLRAKYLGWVQHAFRGTALDWIVLTAACARLPDDAFCFLRENPIALINVNHVFTLQFALRLLRRIGRSGLHVPVILDTHDIQAHLLEERHEINPWTHRGDSVKRLLNSELSLLEKSEVLVHCSVDDFNFFKSLLPSKPQVLALPSIDEVFVSTVQAAPPTSYPIDLLFVGQSTSPNCAAVAWFFKEVWPLICERGYSVKIVGQVDMLVRKNLPGIYNEFRSSFVGPTEQLAPFYRAARCVIAPMISGTGVSVKTIEALALGKPFVGTSKAYRGMPMERLVASGLQTHDTPQSFADAIVDALSNERTAAAASRCAYSRIFSRNAAFASREAALRCVAMP